MKTLYLECGMGAAGDMLTAALLELLPDSGEFIGKMNSLGLEGVEVSAEKTPMQGILGTRIHVKIKGEEERSEDADSHHHHEHHHHHHDHEHHHNHGHEHEHHHHHGHHHHTSLHDIEHLISHMPLSDKVKSDSAAVYRLIAEAESAAHGRSVEEIHFHEVGTLDAVADVVGVCLLMEMLAPERVVVSPVHVGSGHVHCAHGILPVPAPATAHILQGVPTYGGDIRGELCTPTGAALLKYFADSFGKMPMMTTEKIGYGLGHKEFERMNCVRAFLGETEDKSEQIAELICNLDDMTGEEIGFAVETLLDEGALDVFTTPIGMKKSRPAVMLTVLCRADMRERLLKLIFKHTTTIGVREHLCERYVLGRAVSSVVTPHGVVGMKRSSGYGVTRIKPEYEDIARIAKEKGMSLTDVKRLVEDHK